MLMLLVLNFFNKQVTADITCQFYSWKKIEVQPYGSKTIYNLTTLDECARACCRLRELCVAFQFQDLNTCKVYHLVFPSKNKTQVHKNLYIKDVFGFNDIGGCQNKQLLENKIQKYAPCGIDSTFYNWSCIYVQKCSPYCDPIDTSDCKLASIHSDKENILITDLLRDNRWTVWIGLKRLPFAWSDGTPYDFDFAGPFEPGGGWKAAELCVAAEQSYWVDLPCHYSYNYICEWTILVDCPAGAVMAGNRCFKCMDENVTYENALQLCRTRYFGELFSVHNGAELAQLPGRRVWIGLNRLTLMWTDNSVVDFNKLAAKATVWPNIDFYAYIDGSNTNIQSADWYEQRWNASNIGGRLCKKPVVRDNSYVYATLDGY